MTIIKGQVSQPLVPGQLRDNEYPEFLLRGPFGGIQSEIAADAIDNLGFSDAVNMIFRHGIARVRPVSSLSGAVGQPPGADVNVLGFWSLFSATSNARLSGWFTPTQLVQFVPGNPPTLSIISGPPLIGSNLFRSTVVNYKLCFTNSADPVMVWDGISSYSSGDSAPVARYCTELDTHLLAGNCIDAGVEYPQRIHWSAAGDPLTWLQTTDYTSGQVDLLNELGPITGLVSLFQTGYAFQYWGVTQIVPTGNGLSPFNFVKITSRAKGCIAPYSLASYGEFVAYVGDDNIYLFDGSSSAPIGDQPISGATRIGARSRIFADLFLANLSQVSGIITTSINGTPFNAYWLNIPNIAVWVYNFDEFNWTRLTFDGTILSLGLLYTATFPRVIDLKGSVAQQYWSPATVQPTTPFDSVGIGKQQNADYALGQVHVLDYSSYSEKDSFLTTGQLNLNDIRHKKVVHGLRYKIIDNGDVTFSIFLTNDKGDTQYQIISTGTGSGLVIMDVLDFDMLGYYFTLEITASAGEPLAIVELALIYEIASDTAAERYQITTVDAYSANLSDN